MTDETKKLFDAPFAVMGDAKDYTKFNVIISSPNSPRHCCTIASCVDQKTALRLARLPELYDALEEATHVICLRCLASNGTRPPNLAHFKKHCGLDDDCKYCTTKNYWKLLRKVRDGE